MSTVLYSTMRTNRQTANRHVRELVLGLAESKAITSRQIVEKLPGVNRWNVLQWLEGKPEARLAEGTIDRIVEVIAPSIRTKRR